MLMTANGVKQSAEERHTFHRKRVQPQPNDGVHEGCCKRRQRKCLEGAAKGSGEHAAVHRKYAQWPESAAK